MTKRRDRPLQQKRNVGNEKGKGGSALGLPSRSPGRGTWMRTNTTDKYRIGALSRVWTRHAILPTSGEGRCDPKLS